VKRKFIDLLIKVISLSIAGYFLLGSALSQADTVLTAGYHYACGIIADNSVVCWGNNDYGQSSPPSGAFTQISAGSHHTCGLKTNGSIACWGWDDYAQASPPSGTFKQVSAARYHSCGLKTNGTAICWGDNTNGKSAVPSGTFREIAAGEQHTCGLRTDGSIECWGDNTEGQTDSPTGIFTDIRAGGYSSCALGNDGVAVCWGKYSGSLGYVTQFDVAPYSANRDDYSDYTCGLKVDGTVTCKNGNIPSNSTTFVYVTAGGRYYYRQYDDWYNYTFGCGLTDNNYVSCWGYNSDGQTNAPIDVSFKLPPVDLDLDGVTDDVDNCPNVANSDQKDFDGDGTGNACDNDDDNDNIVDSADNCPNIANSDQKDFDGDGVGTLCDSSGEPSPIYRFWSNANKAHFFTISASEKDYIIATYPEEKWKYGGTSYYAYTSDRAPAGTSPVYRFWSSTNKTHFFTISESEKDLIIATYPEEKWKYGGIAWYAYKSDSALPGTSPVYRFWSSINKTHFFTSSESEKDYIIATYPEEKWKYGGIAWYAYK